MLALSHVRAHKRTHTHTDREKERNKQLLKKTETQSLLRGAVILFCYEEDTIINIVDSTPLRWIFRSFLEGFFFSYHNYTHIHFIDFIIR